MEELSEAESLKNDAGDEVDTDMLDQLEEPVASADRRPADGPDHLGAVRVDHRHQRRRAALPDLRDEDAPERQLLRLRGLRQHQRLQLTRTLTPAFPVHVPR